MAVTYLEQVLNTHRTGKVGRLVGLLGLVFARNVPLISQNPYSTIVYSLVKYIPYLRACSHGGGGVQIGEVTRLGGVRR